MSQAFIAGLAILCHFILNDKLLWGSSLIPSIPPQKLLCYLKLAHFTCHKNHMHCFRIEAYLLRHHIPNGHILLKLVEFPCLSWITASCRISVGFLKQNGVLQALEIRIIINYDGCLIIKQFWLTAAITKMYFGYF